MKIKTIMINENTVVKTDYPIRLRAEAEKTIRAFEIGKDSGLFRVPRVLDYDFSKGILVLERLRNISRLAPVLCSGHEDRQLIDTIAMSLATIHEKMRLSAEMHVPLPAELSFPGSDVVLHGDMAIKNIFLTTDRPGIAILDWQMTMVHGGDATYGTRYFDVMWFVSNLFGLMCRLNHAPHLAKHAIPMARLFIKSYCLAANISEDCADVISYMRQYFPYKIALSKQRCNLANRLLNMPVYSHIKKFIEAPQLMQEL